MKIKAKVKQKTTYNIYPQDPINIKECNYGCVNWESGGYCRVRKCKYKRRIK